MGHFNARDLDAVRAMIANDVRLELVNRTIDYRGGARWRSKKGSCCPNSSFVIHST
jgi:hypothetical protein